MEPKQPKDNQINENDINTTSLHDMLYSPLLMKKVLYSRNEIFKRIAIRYWVNNNNKTYDGLKRIIEELEITPEDIKNIVNKVKGYEKQIENIFKEYLEHYRNENISEKLINFIIEIGRDNNNIEDLGLSPLIEKKGNYYYIKNYDQYKFTFNIKIGTYVNNYFVTNITRYSDIFKLIKGDQNLKRTYSEKVFQMLKGDNGCNLDDLEDDIKRSVIETVFLILTTETIRGREVFVMAYLAFKKAIEDDEILRSIFDFEYSKDVTNFGIIFQNISKEDIPKDFLPFCLGGFASGRFNGKQTLESYNEYVKNFLVKYEYENNKEDIIKAIKFHFKEGSFPELEENNEEEFNLSDDSDDNNHSDLL